MTREADGTNPPAPARPAGAVVLGFGGHARVVASILDRTGVAVAGFFDDSYTGEEAPTIGGIALKGTVGDAWSVNPKDAYLAFGDNEVRRRFFLEAKQKGITMPPLVHPSAIIEGNARVAEAAVICAGAIVCAEASLGPGCIVNSGAVVEHECRIGAFAHLAPRSVTAGRTEIGDRVFLGAGAVVAQCLTVGEAAIIGAGVVVLKDVEAGAKILKVHH